MAELGALGTWRKAYAESAPNHKDAITAHFSDILAGKEVTCAKQAGAFKLKEHGYPWFAEKRVGDDGPGIPVRCSIKDIRRYGVKMSLVAEAEEIKAKIHRKVKDLNDIVTHQCSDKKDCSAATAPTIPNTLTYQVKFLGAVIEETPKAFAKYVQDPIQWAAWTINRKVEELSHLMLCFQCTARGNNAEPQLHTMEYKSFIKRGLPKRNVETASEMLNGFLESCVDPLCTQHFPIKFLGQLQGKSALERKSKERAIAEDAIFTMEHSAWVKDDSEWWSQVAFWWEWQHVQNLSGQPLRVHTTYNNLVNLAQGFPHCPRERHIARVTHFTPQCFAAVANSHCKENNLPECEFLGVLYDNAAEGWTYALPQNGLNVLNHAVYWKLQ